MTSSFRQLTSCRQDINASHNHSLPRKQFVARKAQSASLNIKAVIFEGDGWLLCYKVLTSDGHYQWPKNETEARMITGQQFRWLMEGLSIEQKKVIKSITPDIY